MHMAEMQCGRDAVWQGCSVAGMQCGRDAVWQTYSVADVQCGRRAVWQDPVWQALYMWWTYSVAGCSVAGTVYVVDIQCGRMQCGRHCICGGHTVDLQESCFQIFSCELVGEEEQLALSLKSLHFYIEGL